MNKMDNRTGLSRIATRRVTLVLLTLLLGVFDSGVAQSPDLTLRRFDYAAADKIPAHSNGTSVTLLPDGRWLLVGGTASPAALSIVDPTSGGQAAEKLTAHLAYPRSAHSATVLPDGTVFIFGGTGADGALIATAEVFDPVTGAVQTLGNSGLTPRTGHSATLLTDGLVLIAGGLAQDGSPVPFAEFFNPRAQKAELFVSRGFTPRFGHHSSLLSNGQDLLWGGLNAAHTPLATAEVFDPSQRAFTAIDETDSSLLIAAATLDASPAVIDTLPESSATAVALDASVAVRFNKPLDIRNINTKTVTLVGPAGAVSAKVAGAELGMLAFLTPGVELSPGTTYTLFLSGLTDRSGAALPFTAISFTTRTIPAEAPLPAASARNANAKRADKHDPAAAKKQTAATPSNGINSQPQADKKNEDSKDKEDDDTNEDWIPADQNRRGPGVWRVLGLKNDPRLRTVVPSSLVATSATVVSASEAAVSGQIVRLNGKPLAGVSVNVGSLSTVSDADGRFVLFGKLPAGRQVLKVDGTQVTSGGWHYTKHFLQVQLVKGKTIALADPVYLPRVDPATEVSIASPTDHEVILTHPSIPGLEVRIPKGAVLREYDGKVVTKLSITPIPVDRAPYPAPIDFSVYFTLQPGGAFVEGDPKKAVKIIYPNYQGLAPHTTVNFWNYDPQGGGWKVYGQGVVSANGKQVIPDSSVGFRQIMTFGFGIGNGTGSTPPPKGPVPGGTCCGDPVDVATGLFTHTVTDMRLPDVFPGSVTRTYRQDDGVARSFGIGTSLSYSMYLYTTSTAAVPNPVQLILPDGGRVNFVLQSGTSLSNAVWANVDSPTGFAGATLTTDATKELFYLKTGDATVYTFGTHPYNQLQSIADRNGNTITLTLASGGSGNITQVTSSNGRYIQLAYDSCNRISTASDNVGRTVTYVYDSSVCASGRLHTVTDMNGKVEQYDYTDPADTTRMTLITDKRNNVATTNQYDSNGRLFKQTLADGTFWQFDYVLDATNTRVTQTTVHDPRGHLGVMNFNTAGYVTSEISASGLPEQQTYTYTRTTANLVQTVTDQLGRVTFYTYDGFGDVMTVTRLNGTPNALTDHYTYDPVSHLPATYQDPLGHTWAFGRDGLGNLTSITDPVTNKTVIINNGAGQPTSITDPLTHVVQIGYQQNDVSSIKDALGRTTSLFTDDAGRVVSRTSALGYQTGMSYDPMNRITQALDPLNGTNTQTYDQNGNLLTYADPRNAGLYSYGYDARNRVHTYTDPKSQVQTYLYDGMNNLSTFTDRKGQVTQYSYDGLDRLSGVQYQDGSTLTLNWDGGNRLQSVIDTANGTVSWTYDGLDRVLSETTPNGTVSYTYYANGLRKTMTAATQSQLLYCYDGANRLTAIYNNAVAGGVCSGLALTSLNYDTASRRKTLTLPNGVLVTYGYDNANELTGLTYTLGSTTLGAISYTYDADGRITNRTSSLDQTSAPSAVAAYYDPGNALNSWGGQGLTYDANGNLLTDGANTYTWNSRNQLVSISGTVSAAFTYDALGRRLSRTVGSNSTAFVYDGMNLVREQNGATVIADYLVGLGIDETYSRTDSASTQSFLADGLGSTVALTNSSGAITTTYTYDSYGNTTVGGTASANPLQYAGRENDGTGLYFNRARYYSPRFGRFIGQDPLGLGGGSNLYAYVDGNPIANTDPSGLIDSVTAACMQSPEICQEIFGQIAQNAAAVSGNPCTQEAADAFSGALNEVGKVAAVVTVLSAAVKAGYAVTATVAKNIASRPYINSPLLIQEIEATGRGVPDPGGIPNALRYDVPGSYNGSKGTYQLVIDPATRTVYHFLFAR